MRVSGALVDVDWLHCPPPGRQGCPSGGRKKGRGFVLPTETNVHGDALCFVVMGPSVVQRLAVGGWQRLRLVVGGPWGLSLKGVLQKATKKIWIIRAALPPGLENDRPAPRTTVTAPAAGCRLRPKSAPEVLPGACQRLLDADKILQRAIVGNVQFRKYCDNQKALWVFM